MQRLRETTDYDNNSGYDSDVGRCFSCHDELDLHEHGTCRECYEEANDTKEELKREIEELKAKVAFLRFSSPFDPFHHKTYDPSFSDVVLVASEDGSDGYVFPVPAHKAVLVSRSPVFKAMLENEMEESRSGTIKIGDVSYNALRSFVSYMYTAEAYLDDQMAFDLLVLAEKYQVKHLKAYCEKYLVSKLNWDNSIMSYAFAHQHNAKHVLDSALSIITDNMDKLTKREEYMELVEKDPRLVVEIYEAYLAKQVNTAARRKSGLQRSKREPPPQIHKEMSKFTPKRSFKNPKTCASVRAKKKKPKSSTLLCHSLSLKA